MDELLMYFTTSDGLITTALILLTGIVFAMIRAIYFRIRGIYELFKRGRKRDAWKAVIRDIRRLVALVIGLVLIKYMMILGIIFLLITILRIPHNSDIPSYYYDD